ncbi:PaaI family thioesterase [Enterococcus faecalis]|uniref:PaaI family thioesterase n=1 Tax=Enterococcus TaxID=1350 RepID=UPI001571C270|nr:PaaI family thioesterase [Enterococcus faecalis]ELS0477946.1 PaaI family thioesterase [Enterococcus faecalis]MDB1106336.1 PaaI family thioesterase [Enterococcus faecalis]MDT2159876.1 PaaI family thioesterase [Enterococcus faecalis]NSN66169.1 PaaI family thioesterase [Enterococcus faecalis]NST17277.1 PaaI family thioesterase [Enterococcus faecalis]
MITIHLLEYLGITIQQVSAEKCQLTLAVKDVHKQPYGLVHGGLNGVLIETACSLGANENVPENTFAVGIDLQVNHLRSVHDGSLTVIATPDHSGKTLQVWEAKIYNADHQLTSVGRCTLTNKQKKQ